jgi:hypothetical protein
MSVSQEVILEWVAKKKHIQDRLNRIKKRLKKYQKQERHFEFRIKMIRQFEEKK